MCDASRMQYLRVNNEFIKLGAKISKYNAFYIWVQNNVFRGIILVNVDDFKWESSKYFTSNVIPSNIRSTFKVSKEDNTKFKYTGINIKITPDAIC